MEIWLTTTLPVWIRRCFEATLILSEDSLDFDHPRCRHVSGALDLARKRPATRWGTKNLGLSVS
jgi:hypothetical protein